MCINVLENVYYNDVINIIIIINEVMKCNDNNIININVY